MGKVRVGIDVGGTFTDAVAIDNDTYKIIAQEKIPTTHTAEEGVAAGIIQILQHLLVRHHIMPQDVVFIAHGTTQATNALLEGDVASVGILAMGNGFESKRVQSDSCIGDIVLAKDKILHTVHEYIETEDAAACREKIAKKIYKMKEWGAQVIVASESFSVDDPTNEKIVMSLAHEQGLYATGGHEVSQLYGLKVRTRTAVINGSLIPVMMETANMTEICVQRSGIQAPLMIMRCDGGVMTLGEVRRRPILTMLSGLAAGVAGALMYEKMSDGIFLEAGGTSTDISVVRNGKVMVRYARVGGHKTYLNSLDVRTLGIAGGSMVRVDQGKITDVGPRSAHIAGLPYEVFSLPVLKGKLVLIAPCAEDVCQFAAVCNTDGKYISLTLAGAANVLGTIPQGDYAAGNQEAAKAAWTLLGKAVGLSAEEAARQVMDIAIAKVRSVIVSLMTDYELDAENLYLAGGGGSAGVIVPYLGELMGCNWKIVKNAPIISTIGVALAMVREVVERTVVNPNKEDIRSIRREAMTQIVKSGAAERTVEISIEIDKRSNILRAIAMGTNDLRTQDRGKKRQVCNAAELLNIAADSMSICKGSISEIAAAGTWHVFEGIRKHTRLHFFQTVHFDIRVLDENGIIHLRTEALGVLQTTKNKLNKDLKLFIEQYTEYGTIGGKLPKLYMYYGEKQIDLSGLVSQKQVDSVLEMELEGISSTETLIAIAAK